MPMRQPAEYMTGAKTLNSILFAAFLPIFGESGTLAAPSNCSVFSTKAEAV